jgi:hypothetical protein
LNCEYCGDAIESPAARYTQSKDDEKVREILTCPKRECVVKFFDDMKTAGMDDPAMWDKVEMVRDTSSEKPQP